MKMKIVIQEEIAKLLNLTNPLEVASVTKTGYKPMAHQAPFGTIISPSVVTDVIFGKANDTLKDIPETTVANELLSDIKVTVNPSINTLKRLNISHRTHYIKLSLDDAISLRFYYTFDDRPAMQNKWFMWNHLTKANFEITPSILKALMPKIHKAEEVIGRRIHRKYQKLITNLETGIVTVGD